ncbi:MAG TPA: hypothetical protein VFT09_00345, partial [Ilumatobacteraceae bacterium]|nr:hypothetical protein [Ilumatobacteraceae bacterium]
MTDRSYGRQQMKRPSLASVLTATGVLAAGATAALVNTRVLENADGDATGTNRVELDEDAASAALRPSLLQPLPRVTTAPVPEPASTPAVEPTTPPTP